MCRPCGRCAGRLLEGGAAGGQSCLHCSRVADATIAPTGAHDLAGGRAQHRQVAPPCGMCKRLHMATNLAIDEKLLEEALRIGGQKTKKETVNEALREYIQRRQQAAITELFGKLEIDPEYDHKRQRRRR